nr:RNA-directed DNA polymerase [Tanacetum cinerariifolium]
ELPPHRSHDHRIPLIEGTQPVNIRPYRHPPTQKDAIEAMVKKLLESWVIKPSHSPFASPIVMVKKKDNTWRICIDYMRLNKCAFKDKFPIPIIKKLIDELYGAVVFLKLDLRSGYHQIRMCEEDVAKTTFKTHKGHYEFLAMPFRLTNSPSIFQELMNEKVKDSRLKDPTLNSILKALQSELAAKKHYSLINDQQLKKGKIVVGENVELRKSLLHYFHDGTISGHYGVTTQNYLPYLLERSQERNQTICQRMFGMSEGLPKSKGKDVIMVIVDKLGKYAHFIALSHPFIAVQIAQ